MIHEADYHTVTSWFDECRQPLLLTHRRPDGDALGGLAAVAATLRRRGIEPTLVLFEAFPAKYRFLASGADWLVWENVSEVVTYNCDAVVIVDTCALSQLEPAASFLATAPRTLVIDHHATWDPIGTRDGDLRLFDETASATCLMIAEWIRTTGIPFDASLATALYTGIATDCGWFRFTNTDARTMHMAADLVEAGADSSEIYNTMYQQEPPAKLRLIAHMLSNMELHADGRLVALYLRPADFEATGADMTMTEDLVNEASRLGGTEATVMFTEESDGSLRVNLRSKQTLDVAEFARRYGGGGHARAAGVRPYGKWDDVVPRMVAELTELL